MFDAKKGVTILEVSLSVGIYISSLCSHPDLPTLVGLKLTDHVFQGKDISENDNSQEHQGCQLCVVKVEGTEGLIEKGMVISTDTTDIQNFRREKLMNILLKHPHACLMCAQLVGSLREPCSPNVPVKERCCSITLSLTVVI